VSKYSLGFCSAVELDSIRKTIADVVEGELPCMSVDLSELSWETQAKRLSEAYDQMLEL
jgi:hypothetical protein